MTTSNSDGSSLQEWLYGAERVIHGMNPNDTADAQADRPVELSAEMRFFSQVVDQYGYALKRHVKQTFDAYVRLQHEFLITSDEHRPMNEDFRATIDSMLLSTLDELEIFGLTPVMSTEEAIELAGRDYGRQDFRMETERLPVGV